MSTHKLTTIKEAVTKLNDAVKKDPVGITSIFSFMVPCEKSVSDGDMELMRIDQNQYALTPLGIVNGLVSFEDDQFIRRIIYKRNLGTGLIQEFDVQMLRKGDSITEPSDDKS